MPPSTFHHLLTLSPLQALFSAASLVSAASLILAARLSFASHRHLPVLALLPLALQTALFALLALVSRLTHTHSIRSSALILAFFPVYLLAAAIVVRTHVLIARGLTTLYGHGHGAGAEERAAFALWLGGIALAALGWLVECAGPEGGRIKLVADKDGYERLAVDGDAVGGVEDSAVRSAASEAGDADEEQREKEQIERETPVLRANLYSVLTFGWLTRGCWKVLGFQRCC